MGLGLYDQGRGIVSLATPAGWRAIAEGTADAYHEGGIGLAVNQFNPAYHLLVNIDNGWQLAQQGCITQASRALTNATFNAATTTAIAAGGAAATRNTATNSTPVAERLFTSRAAGVDSRLVGHSYARGESGLLNRTGSRLKLGWSSSGEFGGGWHLRLGIGRSPVKSNQARFHVNLRSTHVPNEVANDLLDVIRELNGL